MLDEGVNNIKKIDMNVDDLSNEQVIEMRKLLGRHIKDAVAKSRHEKCMLCDKPGGFCKSHTIPQFCLENIAWNGKLNSINTLIDSELLNKDSGVNNAATFHIICKQCDGKVFQDYEKGEAYDTVPSETALNQIVLKSSLRDIYKHETEIELFEAGKQLEKANHPLRSFITIPIINSQIHARTKDVEECYEIFRKAKDYLSSSKSWLRVVSYDKLNYTVPIAFQGMIALVTGVNGEVINDNFNHKRNYKIEYLHLAVFPLKEATAVMLFLDSANKRYTQFEKYMTDTTPEKRLEIINRIIMLYTEDYFLSKQLDKDTLENLEDSARTLQDPIIINSRKSLKKAIKDYDLRRDTFIPNLFLRDYAVTLDD